MKNIEMLTVLAMAVILGSCFPQAHVSVKNDCLAVWFQVSWLEGSGREYVVDGPLMPGKRALIPLTGTAGVENRFVIMVDGYRLGDNLPVGSAEKVIDVYPSGDGSPVSPRHNYNWPISDLYPYGCPYIQVW